MIHLVSGDLFANRHGAQALAHGVNCAGVMGAGIAVGFRERYPAMYREYRRRCLAGTLEPGEVMFWHESSKPAVFNLATQPRPGPCATITAIAACLDRMRSEADRLGYTSIAMPRIGAGLGGVAWGNVMVEVELSFADWPGYLWVYEEYAPEP